MHIPLTEKLLLLVLLVLAIGGLMGLGGILATTVQANPKVDIPAITSRIPHNPGDSGFSGKSSKDNGLDDIEHNKSNSVKLPPEAHHAVQNSDGSLTLY